MKVSSLQAASKAVRVLSVHRDHLSGLRLRGRLVLKTKNKRRAQKLFHGLEAIHLR